MRVVGGPAGSGRRHERFKVDVKARALVDGHPHDVRVLDISESGAAIQSTPAAPVVGNDHFVELHLEGQKHLQGRVVRNFEGGYALEFEVDEKRQEEMRQELEKFRKIVGRGA